MSLERQLQWYAANIELAGAVCVDVGANVGVVSQAFFDRGDERTQIVSVEPVPQNLAALRERVSRAGAAERWTVVEGVVSDHDGTASLRTQHDDVDGHNSVVTDNPPPGAALQVPAFRLAALAPEATVVKLDVEGHEYTILDDALEAMPGVNTWAIEFHLVAGRPLPPVWARFAKLGYRVFAATAKRSDPKGAWHSLAVPAALDWAQLPVAARRPDGSVFKMVHVLAQKVPAAQD